MHNRALLILRFHDVLAMDSNRAINAKYKFFEIWVAMLCSLWLKLFHMPFGICQKQEKQARINHVTHHYDVTHHYSHPSTYTINICSSNPVVELYLMLRSLVSTISVTLNNIEIVGHHSHGNDDTNISKDIIWERWYLPTTNMKCTSIGQEDPYKVKLLKLNEAIIFIDFSNIAKSNWQY